MENDKLMFGYGRCSTNDTKQDVDRQVLELKEMGCPRQNIFVEYEHGNAPTKVEQEKVLSIMPEGATLNATDPLRLARSPIQMYRLIEVIKERKLRLKIKNSITLDCRDGIVDPYSEAMLSIMAVMGKLELSMYSENVKSGLRNAVAKGVKLGRPRLTEDRLPKKFFANYPKWKRGEINKTDFAKICDVTRVTLDRYIKIVEGTGDFNEEKERG